MKFSSVLLLLACWLATSVSSFAVSTLNGSFSAIAQGSNVNLTAEGNLDWIHWGLYTDSSLNRKATVTPQIRDFIVLYDPNTSYTLAYRYADNYNGYTWSDGTQVVGVTNTPTGVYVVGPLKVLETNGFLITVPADTSLKTLKVYVGTYGARGKFQATLSDLQTSYVDTTLVNSVNGPGRVYTINFAASSPGQTLTILWTVDFKMRADGNVTLQAATLSAPGVNNPPFASITSPVLNSTFASGTNITIEADAFDPAGSVSKVEFYQNGTKIGEDVTSPYSFTMNNVSPGYYRLTANPYNAGATSVSKPIDIFVHSTGGTLNGSVAFPPGSVDLTAEGNMDWVHWGLTNVIDVNRKAAVPIKISALTKIGTNALQRLTDNYSALAWTDGTPTASASNVKSGVYTSGITNGFQFSIPADTTSKTLRVYVGLYGGAGNFQAWLGDFSAPAFTDRSLTNAWDSSYALYTLDYSTALPGQTLTVRFTSDYLFDQDYGNVALNAATLNGATPVFLLNPQAGSGSFTFSFRADSGRIYIVQYTDSLNPINWQTLSTIIGTGVDETVTDSATYPERFYRIQVQ